MLRKIIIGILTVPVLLLFGGLSATAAPAGPEDGARDARGLYMTCSGGYIEIGYTEPPTGDWDWYGLYNDNGPDPRDWEEGLVRPNWRWASDGQSFVTDQRHGYFTVAYWVWDYGTGAYELDDALTHRQIDCRG